MKARYVKEFAQGTHVEGTLALRSKEIRATRSGHAYLSVELADRTGSLPAVYFSPDRAAMDVPVGAVVRVSGDVTSFRGARRIRLTGMTAADTWDPEDLMATCPLSADELLGELKRLVRSVRHAGLRALLRLLFTDSAFFARFSRCPGSQSYHHAYLGGLVEHTVSVADMCARLADRYHGIDRDLLVTAALVHDIGKVDELTFDSSFGYTDEGRLIGHVVMGTRRVREVGTRSGLDESMLLHLEHAILSHHGELEWGSPKRPSTIEALLLHHVDNMDAKAAGFSHALAGAHAADTPWTDAMNLFRRPLFAPKPAEDDRPHPAQEDAQHFSRIA
jgi:3'-5' exoribonuclease